MQIPFPTVTPEEYQVLKEACQSLPAPKGSYLESDFICNLLLTVLDYQLKGTIVSKACEHYKAKHWDGIRTMEDIKQFLDRFPNDKEGNLRAAEELWGYKYWNRIAQLRELIRYFDAIGVRDQDSLRRWAEESDFERSFRGRIKGLSYAVYKWLVMRLGVETIKPDIHVMTYVKKCVGRDVDDRETVAVLERIAQDIGRKVYELDWAIWEHERGGAGVTQSSQQ
jgi:hypothetical protein